MESICSCRPDNRNQYTETEFFAYGRESAQSSLTVSSRSLPGAITFQNPNVTLTPLVYHVIQTHTIPYSIILTPHT